MNKIIPIILVVVLSGCATVREEYTSDGTKIYKYPCEDIDGILPAIYDKGCPSVLGDTCKEKGYTVLGTRPLRNIYGIEVSSEITFVCNE